MAQRNKVKARMCGMCGQEKMTTAEGIKAHRASCKGPDNGQS